MPAPPENGVCQSLDPRIWKACAGCSFQIPTVNSRVYYFPQGHLEHSIFSTSRLSLSHLSVSKSSIQCKISTVQFLADCITDEVYARLVLAPLTSPSVDACGTYSSDDGNDDIVTFSKILTPSDANNGGGFSVPRFCADSIFPPLDYGADPPVQTLSVTDVHGVRWDFRHIYRGTPRRHLLTTGWSKFVNQKQLVAGDSVIFMKSYVGDVFVGIRRAVKLNKSTGHCVPVMAGEGERFSQVIVDALERAVLGLPFEVVYYPKAGWLSDFVVKADVVEAALCVFWMAGMRIKMGMETEDLSRIAWFQGTISSAIVPDDGPWRGSPWRMLQIKWDEPEIQQRVKRVNPWEVEFLPSVAPIHFPLPPAKKSRINENCGLQNDGEGEFMASSYDQIRPLVLHYNSFPAGMQGARQNPNCIFDFFDLTNKIAPQFARNLSLSTELTISGSQSDTLSPGSQSSVHSLGTELFANRECKSAKFQLFGQMIYANQPDDDGDDGCCRIRNHNLLDGPTSHWD